MSVMGNRIRQCRKNMNLSQEDLGEKIGVKKSAVNKYETGEVENIPRQSIEIMCKLFSVSPSYLLGIDEDQLAMEANLIDQIENTYGKQTVELLESFTKLNDKGKQKVILYCDDMTEIERYLI